MRNDECVIYISTKRGSTQTFSKDADGWVQTSSRGIVRRATAKQVLSHILPVLSFGGQRGVTVRVEPLASYEEG